MYNLHSTILQLHLKYINGGEFWDVAIKIVSMKWKHTSWVIISHWFCGNCKVNLGHARLFCRGQGPTDSGNMESMSWVASWPLTNWHPSRVPGQISSKVVYFSSYFFTTSALPLPPVEHRFPQLLWPGQPKICPAALKWVTLRGRNLGLEHSHMEPITVKTTCHLKMSGTCHPGLT